jgi:hypothetical protein
MTTAGAVEIKPVGLECRLYENGREAKHGRRMQRLVLQQMPGGGHGGARCGARGRMEVQGTSFDAG